MNLADSGCNVIVGLKSTSASVAKAQNAGLAVRPVRQAAEEADIIMILTPDELTPGIYDAEIAPAMRAGKYLALAHGFSIHFGFIKPPKDVNVFMVAPKGPGHLVRHQFLQGAGVPCLLAIHQDPSRRHQESRPRVRQRHRRRRARSDRDELPRGNRDRSVRRAVRPVRRPHGADPGGIRNPGRSRLRAGDGLFRMLPRDEADRGPGL